MSRRLALAASLIIALTSATAASASIVGNGGDPASGLTIGSPGVGEANTFTISYADGAGTTPSGYTVHDATADMTLGACAGGCTLSGDNRTAFVPAQQGVTVQTGNGNSSVVITGQEALDPSMSNTITGGTGNDTLSGGHLPDTIDGGPGNDILNGGANGDSLKGNTGDDTLSGGAGNDDFPTTNADGADAINGGTGTDSVDYSAKTTGAISATEDGAANDGVSGEGDNVGGIETVIGTLFADVITLSGTTRGGGIVGGAGDDVLTGSAAAEEIIGGQGTDTIQGGGGGDFITGDSGNDTIGSGAGDDVIFPGPGNDAVDGGPGNDSFRGFANGDGADSFTGGPGDDDLDYSQESGPVSITQDGVANDGGEGENDNIAADIERLGGSPDADTIVGGPANNTILGNGGADSLDGGAGNDIILTSSSDSVGVTMRGGDGSDTLSGSAGDDVLDGGPGDDLLLGNNGGADTFTGGPGTDSVSFINTLFAGGVNISPDGVANDGRSGQGANIGADVENFTGSFGPDTITGAAGVTNRIDGNGGGDTINVASSPADRDTVLCRSTVGIGFARGFGIAGGYNDVVTGDALDQISDQGSTACATIHQPPKVTPHAKILTSVAHTTGHVFTVSFQCLSAVPSCRISAQVATPNGTVLDTGHAVITSGKKGQILFGVSPKRRKALAQGGEFKERVTAVVGDKSGRTSTVSKTITLKGA